MTVTPGPGRFVVDMMNGAKVSASASLSEEAQAILYSHADIRGISPPVIASRVLEIVVRDEGLLRAILEEVDR